MHKIKVSLILFLALLISFNPVMAQDLEEEAKKHYEKGKEYYAQDKYKEAEEEFQKALSLIAQKEKKLVPVIPEYIIGFEDVLFFSVWQDKDLTQEVSVQPDGRIAFPLVGEISCLGLTIGQVKNELVERLKEYIKNPVVSLTLRKVGGSKAIILGQVSNPGVYPIGANTSIIELIGMAGGFTNDSIASSTILIRGNVQNPKGTRLNLTQALDKAMPNQNISLKPGDIIFVPKKFIADVNYLVQQITTPIISGVRAYEEATDGQY